MFKKFGYWTYDYLHALHKQSLSFLYRKPPKHYLGFVQENKVPIILIPGIYEKWHFLKAIADPLSLRGHPVYVLEHLGYNTRAIGHSAELVRELIDEKNLRNVIIIAHSKGGLIGKYVLAYHDGDRRVRKLIAIATPFAGSVLARIIPRASIRELHPESPIIRKLQEEKAVNRMIVSICGTFDNHVWPQSSCMLEGAKNIQVHEYGHHKILFSKKVKHIVLSEVEEK